MDKYELQTFLHIHIRGGAWQVVLLFMDELQHVNCHGTGVMKCGRRTRRC